MLSADCYFKVDKDMLEAAGKRSVLVHYTTDKKDIDHDEVTGLCNDFPDKMLEIGCVTTADFINLSKIFQSSPLYKTQLVFALDQVLLMRIEDETLFQAVERAFHPVKLPAPYKNESVAPYIFKGDIHYKFLDALPLDELLQVYVNCLNTESIKANKELRKMLGFCNIIDTNPTKFLEFYNGFKWGDEGCLSLKAALPRAKRLHYEPEIPLEIYVQRGAEAASNMAFAAAESLVEFWLHADQMQAHYCALLHIVLSYHKKAPSFTWVKGDIFKILEREAMKQVYARKLFQDYNADTVLNGCDALYTAMRANAEDGVDENIEKLLMQSLSGDMRYSGAAAHFAKEAEQRFCQYEKENA